MGCCSRTTLICLCLAAGAIGGCAASAIQEQPPATPGQVNPAPTPPAESGQTAQPSKLNINVVEGAGAVNNVRTRALREFAVEVDDENDKPVPGAVVTFVAPNEGAGGSFAGDTQLLTVIADKDGRAVAGSFRPNSTVGDYKIQVTATLGDQTASAAISQSNQALAVAGAKKSNKKVLILIAVAAAVAVGAGAGLAGHGGSSSSSSSSSTTTTATLGVGSGATVGAPH
jgi:hypothetical protein